jgi:PilX N-terminal
VSGRLRPLQAAGTVRQRGAATLVVVMMLFLVMALLAAYANRGLLFEQRIASGFARAALAQEAAEGGVEWALALLNGPAIDENCQPKGVGGQRFADKYLRINPSDRTVLGSVIPGVSNGIAVDCARDTNNQGWACQCKDLGARTAPAAIGAGALTPSFGLWFDRGARGGLAMAYALGCSDSVVDRCAGADDVNRSKNQLAAGTNTTALALVSAVRTPPAMPLVVKGDLAMVGAGLGLHNTDPRSGGALVSIGGTWAGMKDERLETLPGSTLDQTRVQNEPTLQVAAEDVFRKFLGASPTQYAKHPALRTLTCNGDCASVIDTAYKAGFRMFWLTGPASIGDSKVLGAVNDPLLIVVDGNLTLTGQTNISGMVVTTGNLDWTNATGLSLINGMVLVGGSMSTTGPVDISYQQAVADQLSNRIGSFVRVPGGWIDTWP